MVSPGLLNCARARTLPLWPGRPSGTAPWPGLEHYGQSYFLPYVQRYILSVRAIYRDRAISKELMTSTGHHGSKAYEQIHAA